MQAHLLARFHWISQIDGAHSTDGYFYLVEFRSWLTSGRSYYGTFYPFFPLVGTIGALLGFGPEGLLNGVGVVGLLFHSLALCLLVVNPRTWWLTPLIFALPWISDVVWYRHLAFTRQAFSWSMFLLMFAIWQRYRSTLTPLSLGLLGAYGALALGMHYFTLIVGSVLMAGVVAVDHPKRSHLILAVGVLTAIVFAFASGKPLFQFSQPKVLLGWQYACPLEFCAPYEISEYILMTVAIVMLLLLTVLRYRKAWPLWSLVLVVAIMWAPIWETRGQMGLRLGLSAAWVVFAAVAYFGFLAQKQWYAPVFLGLFCLAYVVQLYSLERRPYRTKYTYHYVLPAYEEELEAWLPPNAFVRATHALNFAFTYYLNRPSARTYPKVDRFSAYFTMIRPGPDYSNCPRIERGAKYGPEVKCLRLPRGQVIQRSLDEELADNNVPRQSRDAPSKSIYQ